MALILFVCVPDQGHLHPLTAVAAQLAKHGSCSVAVASLEQARSGVDKAGLAFISLASFSNEEASEHARLTRWVQGASFYQVTGALSAAVTGHRGLAKRPWVTWEYWCTAPRCARAHMPLLLICI